MQIVWQLFCFSEAADIIYKKYAYYKLMHKKYKKRKLFYIQLVDFSV